MRRSSAFIGLLIVAAVLVGWGWHRGTIQGLLGLQRPHLSIVVREGLEAEGIRQVAKAWQDSRGGESVEVVVDTLGRANYLSVINADIVNRSPKYNVVFFPGTHVPEYASKGLLEPIRYWSPESDPDLMTFSSLNGKIFGLPCDVSTFFTFYRKDIVSDYPKTWDELLEYSNNPDRMGTGGTKIDFSLGIAGKSGEELPKIFYPILWSHGGAIFENGEPSINSEEAVKAATLFKSILLSDGVPKDIQSWGVIEILDAYLSGNISLTTPQWNALYPYFSESNDEAGKNLAIADIPGVRQDDGKINIVNFQHTWDLVIPSSADSKDLANDFILFATGKEGARMYALSARGNPARKSILTDPKLEKSRPEFPQLFASLQHARREPKTNNYTQMHEIVNDALSQIISGTKGVRDALDQANQKLGAIGTIPE